MASPHWHLLLFTPAGHREAVREVMQRYALADSGDEPGAQTHRFQAIEPAKGAAGCVIFRLDFPPFPFARSLAFKAPVGVNAEF